MATRESRADLPPDTLVLSAVVVKSFASTLGQLSTIEVLIDTWRSQEVGDTGLVLGDLESSDNRRRIGIVHDVWQSSG